MGRRRGPRDRSGTAARFVVAAGLAGFTVAVYVVVVLGGGVLLGRPDRPVLGLSVLATAVVALGAEPVRRRLGSAAAGLLGSATSPYDVLRRFSEQVTGPGDASDVPARMARALAEGVDAEWTQVWLSVADRLVLAATWPGGAVADGRAPAPAAEGPARRPSGRRELTVRHGGRVYGVLRLQQRPGTSLTPVEERLVDGLASQSGPVLRLVGLQAERTARHGQLVQRAGELRRSRARLVEAQDAERRRLERDIHDGAQQHLVALAVHLRLVQTVAVRAPDQARAMLSDQVDAARAATRALEELSRGIYPVLLAEVGLVEALRAAVHGAPVPVEVATSTDRWPAELPPTVQAALYFAALEAVQNATKHAAASRISVRVSVTHDGAEVVVEDDGDGFDPLSDRSATGGAGLTNMHDRLDAVGGRLVVAAAPGRGTTVTATVPSGTAGPLPRPRAGD